MESQFARDDLFERLAVGSEDVFSQRKGDALDHFVEHALGGSMIGRPGAQLDPNLAGGGEDGGLYIRLLRVNRSGTLLDFRLGKARSAHLAQKQTRRTRQPLPAPPPSFAQHAVPP